MSLNNARKNQPHSSHVPDTYIIYEATMFVFSWFVIFNVLNVILQYAAFHRTPNPERNNLRLGQGPPNIFSQHKHTWHHSSKNIYIFFYRFLPCFEMCCNNSLNTILNFIWLICAGFITILTLMHCGLYSLQNSEREKDNISGSVLSVLIEIKFKGFRYWIDLFVMGHHT